MIWHNSSRERYNMADEMKEAPVPLAIRQLIELHNTRMREYQQQSLRELESASLELMLMLGLNPQDGWRLDMESMKYVKIPAINGNS